MYYLIIRRYVVWDTDVKYTNNNNNKYYLKHSTVAFLFLKEP
jgi:hypothetical protein